MPHPPVARNLAARCCRSNTPKQPVSLSSRYPPSNFATDIYIATSPRSPEPFAVPLHSRTAPFLTSFNHFLAVHAVLRPWQHFQSSQRNVLAALGAHSERALVHPLHCSFNAP